MEIKPNSNEALHTVAVYPTGFDGTVTIQAHIGRQYIPYKLV